MSTSSETSHVMCMRRADTLEDLQAALVEFLQNAKAVEGKRVDRDTVLMDQPSMVYLLQEKLADGSHVYNLRIAPMPDRFDRG